MNVQERSEIASLLHKAGSDLGDLAVSAEEEVNAVAREFQGLAQNANQILNLTAEILRCVEDDRVMGVLSKVQVLGEAARELLHARLQATSGILETVVSQAELFDRLAQLAAGQSSVARETKSLSIVTSIEVARLGDSGTSFQYLANELEQFSRSVAESTAKVAEQTRERSDAITETRRMLSRELPKMESELTAVESGIDAALVAAGRSLTDLSQAPDRFRTVVMELASRIGAVTTAIQGHDITRQQMEHVEHALASIVADAKGFEEQERREASLVSKIATGMRIQAYQLRNSRQIVGDWLSQIKASLDGILSIGASEVAEIGPLVFERERELTAQLDRIENLEQACQAGGREVEKTGQVLATLADLVRTHLAESRKVRDRLQLLSFNSIVEASHLGSEAAAILEISQNIKRISASWSALTDRSEMVLEQIFGLAERTKQGMEAFSVASSETLNEPRAATLESMAHLHSVGATAARIGTDIAAAIQELRDRIPKTATTEDRLGGSFVSLGHIIDAVEKARLALEAESPEALVSADVAEMEAAYGYEYTTQIEREVLRAAVAGAELPSAHQTLAGNDVELF